MIDASVRIDPSAFVADDVEIGADSVVGPEAAIGRGVRLGAGCGIGPGAWIGEHVSAGDRVEIGHEAVILGNTTLEDDTFVGAGAVVNGQHDPRARRWLAERADGSDPTGTAGRVSLRIGASVGAGAVVLGGVTVGPFGMVHPGAIVSRDVPGHALVAGSPAARVGWSCLCGTQLVDADGHPVPAEPAQYSRDTTLHCTRCGRGYEYVADEGTLAERIGPRAARSRA